MHLSNKEQKQATNLEPALCIVHFVWFTETQVTRFEQGNAVWAKYVKLSLCEVVEILDHNK